MKVSFFDLQEGDNPLNGSPLVSGEETLNLLERLKFRDPFMCELVGENGYKLLMGLGGSVASVQYSRSDGEPPYFEAVAPRELKQIPGSERQHYQTAVEADRSSGATGARFHGGWNVHSDTDSLCPSIRARKRDSNLFRRNWRARSRHFLGANLGKAL